MSHEPYYWLRDFVVRETRTMAFKQLKLLQKKLTHSGFEPERIILFGSYAKGSATDSSDIDVAIWANGFSGMRLLDLEKLAPIKSKYPIIEIHPFSIIDTSENNPFIAEIERTGIIM